MFEPDFSAGRDVPTNGRKGCFVPGEHLRILHFLGGRSVPGPLTVNRQSSATIDVERGQVGPSADGSQFFDSILVVGHLADIGSKVEVDTLYLYVALA
jgi:hypothetical protein